MEADVQVRAWCRTPAVDVGGTFAGGTENADTVTGLLPVAVRRWGLGGGIVLAALGGFALLALFLSYARWQLLEPLPGKAGFKQ